MMFPFARCRACVEVRVLGAAVNSSHGYRNIEQLVDMAKKIAAASSKWSDPFPRCDCSGQLDPVAARYHAFHGGLGRDIVVLWRAKTSFFGRASVELLSWGEDERDAPLEGLSDDDAAELGDNAVLRDAWVPFQLGNAAEGVRRVEHLLESHPGDPLLLEFLPPMLEAGFWAAGATIAARHRSAHPADPEGHFWFGQALYTARVHGVSSADTVPDALDAFARAVALDPDHPGAANSAGDLLRLEKRCDEAREEAR